MFSCQPPHWTLESSANVLLAGVACGLAIGTWTSLTGYVVRCLSRPDRPSASDPSGARDGGGDGGGYSAVYGGLVPYDEFDLSSKVGDFLSDLELDVGIDDFLAADLILADWETTEARGHCGEEGQDPEDRALASIKAIAVTHDMAFDDGEPDLRRLKHVLIARLLRGASRGEQTLRCRLEAYLANLRSRFPGAADVPPSPLPQQGDLYSLLAGIRLIHLMACDL